MQVEDADDEHATPTVLLVQKRRERARVASMPFAGYTNPPHPANGLLLRIPEDEPHHPRSPVYDATAATFSPVPLTPTDRRHLPTSNALRPVHSVASTCPSLPMPDFPLEEAFDALPSVEYTPARPNSRSSAISAASGGAKYTTKLKRSPLPSALSTNDRLTAKFPISQSVRGLSLKPSDTGWESVESVPSILRDGQGLGVERVDRWTLYKWCLFLSVCTVFAAGAAGLVCALLTWFRGK